LSDDVVQHRFGYISNESRIDDDDDDPLVLAINILNIQVIGRKT
jgi:hypothetical protein